MDPDGGTLTYQITTEPTKGEIELTDDGRFVYTPDTNRRGRDYFGFKATDADGNSSQEATVIIRIEKQKTRTTYSDLDGNPAPMRLPCCRRGHIRRLAAWRQLCL